MGLSDAGFHTMVLAAFSLVLPLYWVCPFLQAFCEVPSIRSSSAIYLGLFWIFTSRPRKSFSLVWILGPIMKWAGTTNSRAPQKSSTMLSNQMQLIDYEIKWVAALWSDLRRSDLEARLKWLIDEWSSQKREKAIIGLVSLEWASRRGSWPTTECGSML